MIFFKVTWKGVGIFNPAVFQIGDDVFLGNHWAQVKTQGEEHRRMESVYPC